MGINRRRSSLAGSITVPARPPPIRDPKPAAAAARVGPTQQWSVHARVDIHFGKHSSPTPSSTKTALNPCRSTPTRRYPFFRASLQRPAGWRRVDSESIDVLEFETRVRKEQLPLDAIPRYIGFPR